MHIAAFRLSIHRGCLGLSSIMASCTYMGLNPLHARYHNFAEPSYCRRASVSQKLTLAATSCGGPATAAFRICARRYSFSSSVTTRARSGKVAPQSATVGTIAQQARFKRILCSAAQGGRNRGTGSGRQVQPRLKAEELARGIGLWPLIKMTWNLKESVQHITVANDGRLDATTKLIMRFLPSGPLLYCFVIRRSSSEDWTPVYLGQSAQGRRRLTGYITREGYLALDNEVTPKRLAMMETMVKGLEIGLQFLEVPRGTQQEIEKNLLKNFDFPFNSVQNGMVRDDPLGIDHLPDVNPSLRKQIEYLKTQPKPERGQKQYKRYIMTSTGEVLPLAVYLRQLRQSRPPPSLEQALTDLQYCKLQERRWADDYFHWQRRLGRPCGFSSAPLNRQTADPESSGICDDSNRTDDTHVNPYTQMVHDYEKYIDSILKSQKTLRQDGRHFKK